MAPNLISLGAPAAWAAEAKIGSIDADSPTRPVRAMNSRRVRRRDFELLVGGPTTSISSTPPNRMTRVTVRGSEMASTRGATAVFRAALGAYRPTGGARVPQLMGADPFGVPFRPPAEVPKRRDGAAPQLG